MSKAIGFMFELEDVEIDDKKEQAEIFIGYFEIDLENNYAQALVNLLGSIDAGFIISIHPDTPELREDWEDFLSDDFKIQFNKENI